MFALCYDKEKRKLIVCLKNTAQAAKERFNIIETFSRYRQAEQALIQKRREEQESQETTEFSQKWQL